MLNTRLAVEDDIPSITTLIRAAIAHLMTDFLTEAQIEASHHFMGVDTQLIADRTYFVVESQGEIVGCGGWSRRATLYGAEIIAGKLETRHSSTRRPTPPAFAPCTPARTTRAAV